jgi:5-methylcytosine-specific restriction endonuclease McrA
MPRQLSRRSVPRTALARLPRRPRRRFAESAVVSLLHEKRSLKIAALRDCGRRCAYCATPLEFETATLDHVYPRAHGGTNAPGNLVASCVRCNRLKGDLLPQEFFLRHPWAGLNFMRLARAVHRALKRNARRAVSLACAA